MLNLSEVKNAHRQFLAAHDKAVAAELEYAGDFGEEHVEKHHKFKSRSGRLAKSTKAKVKITKGGGKLRLGWPGVPYAASIDSGARPHVIRPKRAKFLRFRARNGALVFAKRVNHPGNKPYKFGWRAIHASSRRFGTRMAKRMQAIAKRF
jgi:hypothetical protein